MTYSFHPRAEQELDKAVAYYEECRSGLGLEFAEEVYAAIARIIAYPRKRLLRWQAVFSYFVRRINHET